jgi:diguanylate cyclase (GGDEF)-like protein/PAS domain S-box-containing protein
MDLKDEHEAMLEFLYLCPVGLIATDLNGEIQMLNPMAAQILMPLSRTAPGLVNLFDVLQDYAPEVRNLVFGFTEARGTICEHYRMEIRKGMGPAASVLSLTVIKPGSKLLMTVIQDVTRLAEQERALRTREQRLQAIFDGVRDYAIYSLDNSGRIETWNRSAERVEGYTAEEVIGLEYGIDYPPDPQDPARVRNTLREAARDGWYEDEGWRIRKGGELFWANTMVSVLPESDESGSSAHGFSVITRDISERKQTEDELRRMASTDYLTGAYNRRYFFEAAAAEEARAVAEGKPLSLAMIDADRFKQLNDTRGHQFGDRALRTIAEICRMIVGSDGIVARFGGEEFVILLPGSNARAAGDLAERIRSSVENAGIGLTVSIGIAEIAQNMEASLRAADMALYRAKDLGRNRVAIA